ncbi:MAG: archaeosine biosynthesis radical SAM protein RaSEA [Candidatus Thorarchaeota archaeon]
MTDTLEKMLSAVKIASFESRGRSVEKRRTKNPNKPSAAWTAPARVGSEKGTALSIVLSTIGCAHARSDEGGCTMCSYLLDGSNRNPTSDEMFNQFQDAMSKLDKESSPLSVKIYTSGSFLDTEEIPTDARDLILKEIANDDRVKEVVLESRPEYVQDSTLAEVRAILGDRIIEIGMGLESSSDVVRSLCINKNFDLKAFGEAVDIGKKYNVGTRAYVLLKPPFLTERDALLDAQQTVTDAIDAGVSTISLNPVNVQSSTLVEKLWKKQRYRTPWLWSVVEVLRHAHDAAKGSVNVVCDPVGAGKQRGTHNCGKCDTVFVTAIRQFSLTQDVHVFDNLACDCKTLWEHTLKHEDFSLLVHR